MPARRERPGLRLAVADDAGHEQVRIVEGGSERVRERVPELPALVDRPRRLGRDVARDAAGEGELPEELAQTVLIPPDVGIELAVSAFEVRIRDEAGAAVPGAGDVDRTQVARPDRAVQVRVDQVEARCGAEVAE